MQVKTQKQVMVLQNKAQKVADKLNEEVIFITKGVQHIQVQAGTAYQLNAKDFDAKKSSLIAKKVGDDLEVVLKEGVIIFDNYFAVCATDLSCLVSLPTEDGGLYHIVADASFALEDGTQIVYFYGEQSIVSTESSAVSTDDTQNFSDVIASNVGVVVAVVVAAVVVGSSGSGDDGDDDDKLSFTFNDIGLLNNDSVTNDNTIIVDGLKAGETWKYSTDGGATFKSSTVGSFTLDDGTYVAGAIQIKKLDATGNLLGVTKINETSDIIIDTEKSVFTSSTTANVEKDTDASETIYTAKTDDNTVSYTLKSGFQKEKFTINSTTGELRYKDKQTQVGDHKVTIIATDIAGNETEQLITVSVEESSLSTSVAWNGIGDDNEINASDMATAALSGTVVIIGTVTSISISSIVFKKDNTDIHTISNNLPKINSDNTWTLDNDDTWTSKLTQGNYTIIVNLSGNDSNVTDSSSITTTIDTVKPDQPVYSLEDTGSLNNDGITSNGVITINNLEVGATWQYSISGDNGFTNGTGNSFTLANNTTYEANAIQIRQTDMAGNVSDISKNIARIVVDNTDPTFDLQPATTVNIRVNTPITTTVYDAQVTNLNGGNADEGITYKIKGANANKFSITSDTGILTYKAIQTSVHDNDTVTIVATDVAGNKAEQLIIVSVKVIGLSTSIVWSGIGDDNKINANEIVATTLSGTVAIIGTVTSINISSIVFKQGNNVVHTISTNLPSVNASDNTWTLANNNAWTSKLTQGDYTVTVNLSSNDGNVTDSSSITTTIDTGKPAQPAFTLVDTGLSDNDGITSNGLITVNGLEVGATWQYSVNGGNSFVNGTGSSFMLANNTAYVANAIQIKQTDAVGNVSDIGKNTLRIFVDNTDPTFDSQPTIVDAYVNNPITTTVYDAQVTNLNGGTVDEGISYRIKGTNADKFSITTDTGILTYKTIQTSAHDNDTVTIVATDVAGNETEQLITVSVKVISLSTSIVWSSIGGDDKINADEMTTTTLSGTVAIAGTVNSINISSIVFKQGNTSIHTISNNLPSVNSDNTWTLANNNTWTSKLIQGDYTIIVNLSGNGGSITNPSSITTTIDTGKPAQPTFTLVDTGSLNNDGITSNGLITVNGLEAGATWQYSISGDNNFVNGTGNSFTLANNATYAANAIQVRQTDAVGNVSDISKNIARIIVDNTNPIFDSQPTTIDTYINTPITTTVYDAQVTNLNGGNADEDITYSIKGTNADKFSITTDTGILTYTEKQTTVHDNDIVTIVATDLAGNKTEQLITVSVKAVGLSISVVWNGIGDDNKINANEIASATLSGTVAIIGSVNLVNISEIIFKQGDNVVHTINSNDLPGINANDNTWALANNNTWTSKLTQGEYTVSVKISGNGGSVAGLSSVTVAVDMVKPDQPTFTFEDTGLLNDDGITSNGVITINNLEVGATLQYSTNGDNGFVNSTGNSFMLTNNAIYETNAIQIRQIDAFGNVSDISKNASRIVVDSTGPIFEQQSTTVNANINTPIATTVYDAQATNFNGGNADENVTYRIKGTNANKFLITTDTGILTYKTIQTSVHNDTVIIVATDIAGNETERSITVSVKILAQGFVINGENADDHSGKVSTAGDVNGDGLDDLIVGAIGSDPSNKTNAGKSYVVFGKINDTAINLSAIASGTGGFVINGENVDDGSGVSVSNAGDVNGDGLDDLIVGAYKADSKAGKSYVIFGKKDSVTIDLSAIASGTGGFVINGESKVSWSGFSVSTAGDVNGDGLDDLIVGAFLANTSYVIFGKRDSAAINLSAIASGTGGFVINGEIGSGSDWSGQSVSTAGDVNGDGLDDLIVGANGANTGTGKSYVIFGKKDSTTIDLSAIASGTGGFVINGENTSDWSGVSVSSAGDINGDGLDDLIIGAQYATPSGKSNAGKSYVVFGKTDSTAINLSTIASGTGGFVINGENAGDWNGKSVSTAGDVNGDGLDDLIVGSPYKIESDGSTLEAGKSYVIFGKIDSTAIDLSAIASGTGGFIINGENIGDRNGVSVSTAGDVNGDGLDDLIVGAIGASPSNKSGAGKSYVIFGKTDTNAINLTELSGDLRYAIDHLGDKNANILTGTSGNEIFVAGAGNDTLIGNGGMDVLNAGSGNDTIAINASNITALAQTNVGNRARVDGGGNIDTLTLDGSGLTLDLTNISNARIQDIEKIDITGSGNNTLILNLNDLFDASTSTNILKVLGNSGDSVNASGFAKISNAETEGSITYDVYTHSGANTDANAALWVQQDVGVVL